MTALRVSAQNDTNSIVVPFGGNAWSSAPTLHTVYFRLRHTGTLHVTTGQYVISTFDIRDTGFQTLKLSETKALWPSSVPFPNCFTA